LLDETWFAQSKKAQRKILDGIIADTKLRKRARANANEKKKDV
jgi:hypothetical protein